MMSSQHKEEDLDLDLISLKDSSKELIKEEVVLSRVNDLYKNKMLAYMKSVPHITPTQFELGVRHQNIKQNLLKQMKLINKSIENCAVNRLVDKCETQLEVLYKMLAKENTNEYKRCQLGFTLGWKCNVNRPKRPVYEISDDRF